MTSRSKIQFAFFVGSLIITLVMIGSPRAAAHHDNWDNHIFSMHSATYDEEICAVSESTLLTSDQISSRVAGTLWKDNPASDWDEQVYDSTKGRYRIYFNFRQRDYRDTNRGLPCNELSSSDLDNTELQYTMKDNPQLQCFNTYGVSCVQPISYQTYPGVGHADVQSYYVYLKSSHVSGDAWVYFQPENRYVGYHHVINHETGHTLGLADPGVGNVGAAGYRYCPDLATEPMSVMHSWAYRSDPKTNPPPAEIGCDNLEWPKLTDGGFTGKWYDLKRVDSKARAATIN